MEKKQTIRGHIMNGILKISPIWYRYVLYIHFRHRWPNFKHPKDLSEIIMSESMSGELINYAPYVDKVKVRNYIEEWGYGECLPKLYGVWESADSIDFDALPTKFALKVNNGCGDHLFCKDKTNFDQNAARKHIDKLLKTTIGGLLEPQYSVIKPLVYAEELLEQEGLDMPVDYKYLCCDGEIRFIEYIYGRHQGSKKIQVATLSPEWKLLDYASGENAVKDLSDLPKPKADQLKKMNEMAASIAKRFTHVRVDLYAINDKVYFGELTFSPAGGMLPNFNNAGVEAAGH